MGTSLSLGKIRPPAVVKRDLTAQGSFYMRKIISVAALTLAAITSAWGDATGTIDPKSAVEFVLSTCLPVMDDVASIDRMGQENNWFHLPTIPSNSPHVTQRSRWSANGFFIATWVWNDGNLPSCFVGLRPYKKVNRDAFFHAISSSLELKLISDNTIQQRFRQETYEIIGERRLKLLFGSDNNDDSVSSAGIYMDEQGH
jgi:hypothetical protein